MTANGVLTLGIFLVVGALLILVGRGKAGSPADPLKDARAFVGRQIDAHLEQLARTYLEAGSDHGALRPGQDRFAQEIERFIGDVLSRHAERSEPYLREALRELLVLERDHVYGEVLRRVQAHTPQSPRTD
jgi:hypothetical protein